MKANFNKYDSIDAYYGEPCIYAVWDENNAPEFTLLTLSHESGYGCIGIGDEELNDWQACTPDDETLDAVRNYFRACHDDHAGEDDYTSDDVDEAIAFFEHKNNNQYILIFSR